MPSQVHCIVFPSTLFTRSPLHVPQTKIRGIFLYLCVIIAIWKSLCPFCYTLDEVMQEQAIGRVAWRTVAHYNIVRVTTMLPVCLWLRQWEGLGKGRDLSAKFVAKGTIVL